ncbi:hypothetical protein [Streptomyces zagrosensis]|uniref:Uncharacterized protein n=1 Tax=Streptomyces zagrosensis TaxID=1042984 RepID=A0A7W9QCT8_9ACTN|nr:hypothetical protein [Streptomyces zagrosensis]MBB5937916.1 hypothetical protein [Streptomyces zagrosensis]
MSARQLRVALLVWKPRDPHAPGDVSGGLPQVLLVHDGAPPWHMPSVILRPGELLLCAAERAAYALGLVLPHRHRVLATDLRHPRRMTLVVDGGWTSGTDAQVAAGELSPCHCHPTFHRRRWAASEGLDDVMTRALHAALTTPPT